MAMTNNYKLIAVTDFYEPRPKLMADTGIVIRLLDAVNKFAYVIMYRSR